MTLMGMAVVLMIVDTQYLLAFREIAFPAFEGELDNM